MPAANCRIEFDKNSSAQDVPRDFPARHLGQHVNRAIENVVPELISINDPNADNTSKVADALKNVSPDEQW